MKEAFWGTLIIILGLFGIVVINIFQNVTVDNDRVYYLIKESTQAAALDALDLTYYRLNGDFRIVEDKFVENLTRRFAENVTIGDYTIIVEDINEMPPKVSLRVRSGATSLNGEEFGILNRVDGIIEAKYSLDEVLDFLGIEEEEWNLRTKSDSTDNTCNVVDIDEPVCIPGDLKFVGFGETQLDKTAICEDENAEENVPRKVKYRICECGQWEDKVETIYTNPVPKGNEYEYTWTFTKTSNVRTISESIKETVKTEVCTTGIQEMVPSDIQDKKPTGSIYEPSSDNSKYIVCPPGGIRIVKGMNFMMHPNYILPNSVNRKLDWYLGIDSDGNYIFDDGILKLEKPNKNPNENPATYLSKIQVIAKNIGTSYVNVITTRNQTASCLVNVVSGYVDNLSCDDLTLEYGASGTMRMNYSPSYAIYKDFKWSIDNTNIATIDKSNGKVTAKNSGTATVTISAEGNKSATCKLKVNLPKYPDPSCENLTLEHNSTGTLKYSYSPSNATNARFTFSIDNSNIATINSSGKVVAKNAGTATVTMRGEGGKTTTCKVTVNLPKYPDPSCQSLVLQYNGSGKLKYSYSPSNATNATFTFSIDNTKIATIDSSGNVKAKNAGTATVTMRGESGKTTTCKVTVKPAYTTTTTTTKKVSCYLSSKAACNQEGQDACQYNWTCTQDSNGCYTMRCAAAAVPSTTKSTTTKTVKLPACFLAGTKVLTDNGYKDINKIKVNDKVLSYNEDTKKNEYKKVTNVFIHKNTKDVLYTININNKVVEASSKHQFYVKTNNGNKWIAAENLEVGYMLRDKDGKYYKITNISKKNINTNLYNIEVEDNHNYYVTKYNILVHNKKANNFVKY